MAKLLPSCETFSLVYILPSSSSYVLYISSFSGPLNLAATLNGRKGVPPWEQLQDLVAELEHYQEGMTQRPSLIVANKIDEEGAEEMYEELKRRVHGVPIFPVCAILQEGVPDLRVGLRNLMDDSDPQGIDFEKNDC